MPTELLIVLIIAGAAVAVFLFLRSRKEKDAAGDSWMEDTTNRIFRVLNTQPITTPAGHSVHYEEGLTPNSAISAGVDIGVDKCFTKFECAYPNVIRALHHIHVCVLRPEADSQGNPCYRVRIEKGDPYYDSEWDKMVGQGGQYHYILAAGQTVAAGEPHGDVIAIAYGAEAWTAQITEYEMEHVLLAWHDGPKYDATKFHGGGTGHPLQPDCPGESTARSAIPPAIVCGGGKA